MRSKDVLLKSTSYLYLLYDIGSIELLRDLGDFFCIKTWEFLFNISEVFSLLVPTGDSEYERVEY